MQAGRVFRPQVALAAGQVGSFVPSVLNDADAARAALEGEMDLEKYEYQSEFARKYVAVRRAEGKAEAVVLVLEGRGLHVDAKAKQRVASLDADELDVVLGRAAVASTLDELFAT